MRELTLKETQKANGGLWYYGYYCKACGIGLIFHSHMLAHLSANAWHIIDGKVSKSYTRGWVKY